MVWWYHYINTEFHHAKGVICTCNMWSTSLSWPIIAWCRIKGSAKLSNFYPYVPLIYMYLTIYDTPPCPITLNCLNFIYSYPIIHKQIVKCISIKKNSLKISLGSRYRSPCRSYFQQFRMYIHSTGCLFVVLKFSKRFFCNFHKL